MFIIQEKNLELLFSSLQESSVNFAKMQKKTILEKFKKKNEILASREILFLFIVDPYNTNKK